MYKNICSWRFGWLVFGSRYSSFIVSFNAVRILVWLDHKRENWLLHEKDSFSSSFFASLPEITRTDSRPILSPLYFANSNWPRCLQFAPFLSPALAVVWWHPCPPRRRLGSVWFSVERVENWKLGKKMEALKPDWNQPWPWGVKYIKQRWVFLPYWPWSVLPTYLANEGAKNQYLKGLLRISLALWRSRRKVSGNDFHQRKKEAFTDKSKSTIWVCSQMLFCSQKCTFCFKHCLIDLTFYTDLSKKGKGSSNI